MRFWKKFCRRAVPVAFFVGFAMSVGAQEAPTLMVDDAAAVPHVVDARSFTVYAYIFDEQSLPVCVDACAAVWMPVLVVDSVGFATGIELRLIGSIERPDGAMQLTYNDWPLYRFTGDASMGDMNGIGVDDAWYVLDPAGSLIVENSASQHPLFDEGGEVFSLVCATCHGAQGSGSNGPRLVGRTSLQNARDSASKLIRGFGYMPAFGAQLSNEEIAAVLTFVRNSWGNDYGPVTPEEVRTAR